MSIVSLVITNLLENIMIDDDGRTPVLMDLGSLAPSPTPITSRSLAIAVQDEAAENSTMPSPQRAWSSMRDVTEFGTQLKESYATYIP